MTSMMSAFIFVFICVTAFHFSSANESVDIVDDNVDTDKTSSDVHECEYTVRLTDSFRAGPTTWAAVMNFADNGCIAAQLKVAWIQLLGNSYIGIDLEKAYETFKMLSDRGVSDAQFALGFMHANGIGMEVNEGLAILYYTFASLGNSTMAHMAMGYRQWTGQGVPVSCELALDNYRRAATSVVSRIPYSGGPVVQKVRLSAEIDVAQSLLVVDASSRGRSNFPDRDMIQYYQVLADKGDIESQVALGQLYFQGSQGLEPDHKAALSYFTSAANSGSATALAHLGLLYLEGSPGIIESDVLRAYSYFERASAHENPIGMCGLGIMYLHGIHVPKDYDLAFKFLTAAADKGCVEAQLYLGNIHFHGLGRKANIQTASKHYNFASLAGNVIARFNLAEISANGIGTPRSCPVSVELYKNVAERGDVAMTLMDAHADFKKYDRVTSALMKYTLLAELGFEVAQSNAAFILDKLAGSQHGSGQSLFDTILDFFTFNSPNELSPFNAQQSQNEMTLLHSLASNMTDIYNRAYVHWSRSAAQGYSPSRVKLGDFHYYGLVSGGGQRDLVPGLDFGDGQHAGFSLAMHHYRLAGEQQSNAQAMFNLGYMHERGLGELSPDLHLAKRCYDAAAELSPDARIPVAMALAKLSCLFLIDYVSRELHEMMSSADSKTGNKQMVVSVLTWIYLYWDLLLATIICGILSVIFFKKMLQRRQDAALVNSVPPDTATGDSSSSSSHQEPPVQVEDTPSSSPQLGE